MNKFWRVVVYEYKQHVLNRRFLFGLLSLPTILAVMALVIFLLFQSEANNQPVGYIDRSGLLAHPLPAPRPESPDRPLEMIAFQDETLADAALQAKEIQVYYVLGADYLQTRHAREVILDKVSTSAQRQFANFVRVNLLSGLPPEVAQRLIQGSKITLRSVDGSREMGTNDWLNLIVPFFAGFAFLMAMLTSSGYLMQAVVEEKENRTMEVMVTSVSPGQLMSGKVIGLIGVGLTQVLVWIGGAAIVVLVGGNYWSALHGLRISPEMLLLMVVTMIPSFVLMAALMTTVGATITEAREGQQITGLFTMPLVIPYWFIVPIISNPGGPLALAFSFFPLTSVVTITLRAGFSSIPLWQTVLALVILVVCAMGALWLSGRAFRLGMLRYGQRVSLRELFEQPKKAGSS